MQSYSYNYGGGAGGWGQQQEQRQYYSNNYSSSTSPMVSSYSSINNARTQTVSLSVFGQDPFSDIGPSAFPPGTDPKIIDCFNRIDRDGNGVIDDLELQAVLSATSAGQNFSLRTVHLLMFQFTHSNKRQIGPKEFVPLLSCLTNWRAIFQRYDRDRNGSIDSQELGQALISLGYKVSYQIVSLLISKFSKSGGRCSLKYDNFIECCLTVKGLTETFRAKEDVYGRATFGYEEFLLNVMPFIIA